MVGNLIAGAVLGYIIGRDGRPTPVMAVAPTDAYGRPLTLEELGLSPLGLEAALHQIPRGVMTPIAETLHHDMRPRTNNGVEYLQLLLDARLARLLVLQCKSTCNQALTVQMVGHVVNSPGDTNGLVNIGATRNLPASNGNIALNPILEETWMPYMGVTVTAGATAPTSGSVVVQAFGQRWMPDVEVGG